VISRPRSTEALNHIFDLHARDLEYRIFRQQFGLCLFCILLEEIPLSSRTGRDEIRLVMNKLSSSINGVDTLTIAISDQVPIPREDGVKSRKDPSGR
jgi:hypothetical protein